MRLLLKDMDHLLSFLMVKISIIYNESGLSKMGVFIYNSVIIILAFTNDLLTT
jgi:hypothetical protein